MNMTEKLLGVVRAKACSIKAEAGGTAKQINLQLDYAECTIEDILTKAVAHDVISWQNGQGRKHFTMLTAGQTVKVMASRPGAAVADPEAATIAFLRAMTPENREEWILDHLSNK